MFLLFVISLCLFGYLDLTFHSQDAEEYAECEAVVKDYPPFRESMKKRGVEDMDLLMVDAWLVKSAFFILLLLISTVV